MTAQLPPETGERRNPCGAADDQLVQPRQPFHHSAKMLLLLAPASTGLAARAAVGRAAVGRHQPLRMMASECPRLPDPEQSEQSQTATFAMG